MAVLGVAWGSGPAGPLWELLERELLAKTLLARVLLAEVLLAEGSAKEDAICCRTGWLAGACAEVWAEVWPEFWAGPGKQPCKRS